MLLRNIIGQILREAAMADGADAGTAAPASETAKPSVHERLKAHMFGEPQKPAQAAQDDGDAEEGNEAGEIPNKPQQAQAPQKPAKQAAPDEQAQSDDADGDNFTSLSELAERTGLTLDRLMDLSVAGKVGGKDTKASIREMLSGYQTSELLNSKLSTHAAEVQAWKTQQQQDQAKFQQNLQRMDAGLQVAQRLLQGEFDQVNWAQLQQSDPVTYSQTWMGFQQRQAQLDQIAQQLGTERQQQQAHEQAKRESWESEQRNLLEAKIPDFADKAKRQAKITEYASTVGKAVGFTAEELAGLRDHRDFLVLDMAHKWQQLQASKATVMNKVRTAPPILKPGTAQSQTNKQGIAIGEAKAKLRKSGSVRDLAAGLRAGGFV